MSTPTAARTAWEPTPEDRYSVEHALERLPFVTRACVARHDERGTVVLVTPGSGGPDDRDLASSAARVLREEGLDPATVTVRATSGWLPGRDAFPPEMRRRSVRARYAPLLVGHTTPMAPLLTGAV